MKPRTLLLGIDGGGTRCRARLCAVSGDKLGEAEAGPANIRLGLERSLSEVLRATQECLRQAGLSRRDLPRISACLALAGASEPQELAMARQRQHPFGRALFITDARAACVGAHQGQPGSIIVAGTGTIGWAELDGRSHRVGGWGFPISDEGSGAWIGCEVLRRTLSAYDGRTSWTALLRAVFERFDCDPHAIVRFSSRALPRDFGALAPLVVDHAQQDDAAGADLMQTAGSHIDRLAARLIPLTPHRLALVGGLAPYMPHWLPASTRSHLVAPAGDALDGALALARSAEAPIAA